MILYNDSKRETVPRPQLSLNPSGKFKIVQFTDLHYMGSEEIDSKNDAFIADIVGWEKPDFVVYSGDMVSGYAYPGNEKGWYESLHSRYTRALKESNVPYAIVLGNHDREADLSPLEILTLDSQMENSYTLNGPYVQNTDYLVPVTSPNGQIPIFMIFVDTGREDCEGKSGWGCVPRDQVRWLGETLQQVKKDHPETSFIVYIHIPMEEYLKLVFEEDTLGHHREQVSCSVVNTGLFRVLAENADNVISVHCGHDHWNDFYGRIGQIALYYGRKSGYGPYSLPEDILPGVRVMEFDYYSQANETTPAVPIWNTWIRNANGSIESSPIRNSPPGLEQLKCPRFDEMSWIVKVTAGVFGIVFALIIIVGLYRRFRGYRKRRASMERRKLQKECNERTPIISSI